MARADDVKKMVSIPKYFEEVIVPKMGSYYDNYPVDFSNKPVVCCPLHDEDTPSMRYYEETNSFYCFGCRNGGDVIQLHRKFMERQNGTKPSFKEAVDFLYSYFVEGRETTAIGYKPYKSLLRPEIINEGSQLIKFKTYYSKLSSQLFIDNSISDEDKLKLWKLIDDYDILIELNEISVDDAVRGIKDSVDAIFACG